MRYLVCVYARFEFNIDIVGFRKIKNTLRAIWKAKRETKQAKVELKEDILDMTTPSRQTMGDYCRRTDVGQISLGFQPPNLVTFNIKNYVLSGLRENIFDGQAVRDP